MISLSQRCVQGNYGNFPMRASQLWYAGSDGKWLAVAATVEKHWQRLCGAIDRPDLIEDERCVDRPTRQRNLEWIVVRSPCLLSPSPHVAYYCQLLCAAHGVCCVSCIRLG